MLDRRLVFIPNHKLLLLLLLRSVSIVVIVLALNHHRYFLHKLEKVDAMFRVSIDDFFSLDVGQIILKDLLSKQINQSLDVFRHLTHVLSSCQLAEVYFRKGCLEELNIKLIA
jgi:hypothetical protein